MPRWAILARKTRGTIFPCYKARWVSSYALNPRVKDHELPNIVYSGKIRTPLDTFIITQNCLLAKLGNFFIEITKLES